MPLRKENRYLGKKIAYKLPGRKPPRFTIVYLPPGPKAHSEPSTFPLKNLLPEPQRRRAEESLRFTCASFSNVESPIKTRVLGKNQRLLSCL